MPHRAQSNSDGELLADVPELTLDDLKTACGLSMTEIIAYVGEGIVEPTGRDPAEWRFSRVSLITVRRARRLERDLGLNAAGAALALDLMAEIESLKCRLARFEPGGRTTSLDDA